MNRQGQFGGARKKVKENGEAPPESKGGPRGGRERSRYGPFGDWAIEDKLMALGGPLIDLPPREEGLRKFSNHCRLWVGNVGQEVTEAQLKELFKPYGEYDELYLDSAKGFALIRFDYKSNAEKAKQELQQKPFKGRMLKIRNSNPGTSLRIRNLSNWVTNELLEKCFGVFGDLERAIVTTDDRGKPTGEGIVEFCKKPAAQSCLRKTTDGCFFLTASPRPVIVEPLTMVDENDGYSEQAVPRRNAQYIKERQQGPRFAGKGSFEFEYGLKWKRLYELFDKKKEALEKELADEKKKLEEQIEFAKYQHETERLREELQQREEVSARTMQDYEQRQKEWDDYMMQTGEKQKMIEEDLYMRLQQQDMELRRRQEENRQFMQQQQGPGFPFDQGHDDFDNYDRGNMWRQGGMGGGTNVRSRLGTRIGGGGGSFELGMRGGSDKALGDVSNPPQAVLNNPLVKSAVFRVYKELVKELYPDMGPETQLERARHLSTLPMSDLTYEERQFVLTNPDVMDAIQQIMVEMQDAPSIGSGPSKKRKKRRNKGNEDMDFE